MADVPFDISVSPLALILFTLELLGVGLIIYRYRALLRAHTGRQWLAIAGLAFAAFITSQLFPLDFPWSNPVLDAQPDLIAIHLLSAVPWLLAGAVFNPAAAAVVGLMSGLGRALGQTNTLLDVTTVALVAAAAGALMSQNYSGRAFHALRHPMLVGMLMAAPHSVLIGLNVVVRVAPIGGWMTALDIGLYTGFASSLLLALEGVVGGLLAAAIFRAISGRLPERSEVASPFSTSLQRYMTASFLGFTVVLAVLSAGVIFYLSTRTLSRSVVQQLAYNADSAAASVPALQSNLKDVLVEFSSDDRLVQGNPSDQDKALGQIARSAPQFGEVLLLSANGVVTSATGNEAALTEAEMRAAAAALASGRAELASGGGPSETSFSLVVPLANSGVRTAALVGRVPQSSFSEQLADLPGPGGLGNGFVVDGSAQVIFGVGRNVPTDGWQPPSAAQKTLDIVPERALGTAFETLDSVTGGRRLIYYTSVPGSDWRVVASTPHEVILRQALGVIAPVAGLVAAVSIIFFLSVAAFGRSVTGPLSELAETSKAIAGGGGLERTVRVERDDELGQLSFAFGQMQRSLKQRLDELGLLLTVSNEVASSMNLSQGMPAVLQGVLRGTGAAGARAVVRNPNATYALIFSEGPGADAMSVFDRVVMTKARRTDEILLSTPGEVAEVLGIANPPVSALYALPLKTSNEYQGVVYLGYRQPHHFDSSERNLLRTLAGQAAVLVQNAHLFSAADSGRKRLSAILTSTNNAVIVTDQTDRVLLINPAMERAFGLKAADVASRPVTEVVRVSGLAGRLSVGRAARDGAAVTEPDGKLELEHDGRTYLANIATVQSSTGQLMGRVAVLHDVTDFKELDRMKSDFLAGISHDLLSPLTYMRNYASSLPIPNDRQLEQEYIDKIMGGIDRMTTMVNDLLELARIEARINLKMAPVDVADLLEDIKQEYWSHARMNGLDLKVDVPADRPLIQADAGLLRRAIANLISNAIKYAPDSGELRLAAAVQPGEVTISLNDNGPGIPADEQPQLFERFHRTRQAGRNKGVKGSGLGLAIVKSIAEQHGGRVGCISEVGRGTTMSINLPA